MAVDQLAPKFQFLIGTNKYFVPTHCCIFFFCTYALTTEYNFDVVKTFHESWRNEVRKNTEM